MSSRISCTSAVTIVALWMSRQLQPSFCNVNPAFVILPTGAPMKTFTARESSSVSRRRNRLSMANVGGDEPPNRKDGDSSPLDDFLDPNKQESDNLKRARSFFSEDSLPITFSSSPSELEDDSSNSESVDTPNSQLSFFGGTNNSNALRLKNNPYLEVVSRLSPSDLIAKFTSTAHPRVQDAVRATILGLIGNLPKMAFETKTITTGERLAHLMFQLQMTGYMFKNADYRLSLSQSLNLNSNYMLSSSEDDENEEDDEDYEVDQNDGTNGYKPKFRRGKIRGKIKITFPQSSTEQDTTTTTQNISKQESSSVKAIEVDAAAYMSELSNEVESLRQELLQTRMAKEEAIRKDLLLYIRTLPKEQLKMLTGTISEDVLVAMKALVNVVMSGMGKIGPDTVTEQSGEAMAQLCMWQLVVGFNLRELEVREEMKASLALATGRTLQSASDRRPGDELEDGSVDFNSGGFE